MKRFAKKRTLKESNVNAPLPGGIPTRIRSLLALTLSLSACVSTRAMPAGADLSAELYPTGRVQVDQSDALAPWLAGAAEIDTAAPLTYDGSALAAVAMHPDLRAARAQRGVGRAQITAAGILANPQLSAGMDIPTDGPTAGTRIGYSAEVSWTLNPLFSSSAAIGAEEQNLGAIELDIAWQEWQVAQAARLGVIRMVHVKRRLAIARRAEAAMSSQDQALSEAVASGNATILELAAAQSTLQGASLAVLRLVQDERVARIGWLSALGLPPNADAQVATDALVPSVGELPPVDDFIGALPERRLDLAGLRRGFDAQNGRIRAAAIRAFPAVTLAVRRSEDTSNLGTVGFGIAIALPFFDRNQGQIAIETASRDQLHDAYLSRVQRARFEVAEAYANLVSVCEQKDLVETWVPTLEQLVESSESLVGQGNVSVIDLYDLRLRLLGAQLLRAELDQAEAELAVALELASGAPRHVRSQQVRSAQTPLEREHQ